MVSKIESVTPAESYTDDYGQKWAFIYTFQDGTVIKASHKSQASPFQPGQEAEYEIKGEYEGVSRGSVKKPGFNGAGNSAKPMSFGYSNDSKDVRIGNQWAINCAVQVLQLQVTTGSQITIENIGRLAKELIELRESIK
jgi:hypothetical protein